MVVARVFCKKLLTILSAGFSPENRLGGGPQIDTDKGLLVIDLPGVEAHAYYNGRQI
jgi:hypothetical protein